MKRDKDFEAFISAYNSTVAANAKKLRRIISSILPGIIEQVDLPARMVAYSYGRKYNDMICTIIPSLKGVKLGFYKGNELPDPGGLLCGKGKISRYVEIKEDTIAVAPLTSLLKSALDAYSKRKLNG